MLDLVGRESRGSDLSRDKIDLLKQTVARGVSDTELQLFLHACKRTGLDPFMKQIHAIKRWSAKDQREVMSIQTSIDGYRLIADRTGCYAGSSDPDYDLNENGYPDMARVTVIKLVNGHSCSFSASARWAEYCQYGKDGQPGSMWKRMPFLMLGKCAEALALRKAFPAELSGVYTHEEMMQADEPKSSFIQNKNIALEKIADIAKGELIQQEPVIDSAQVAGPPHVLPTGESAPTQMTASNCMQQLRLCESLAEASQVMNQWSSENHSTNDNADIRALFDYTKKRLAHQSKR